MTFKVVSNCELVTREARRTSTICHRLLLKMRDAGDSDNAAVAEELLLLVEQSTYRYPVFTANGFFVLNYGLLLSLADTIASYVIILLQIHK